MGSKRSGRRERYTPDVHERIVGALKIGAFKVHAAEAAGVSIDAVDRWLRLGREGDQRYETFAREVEQAQGQIAMRLVSVVTRASHGGDWKAAAWLLERRFPEVYRAAMQPIVGVKVGEESKPQSHVVFYLPSNGRRPDDLNNSPDEHE